MSINAHAKKLSKAEPASPTSPLGVLQSILSNPTDLDFVKQFTTDDFIYVSLNYEHAELKRIMPPARAGIARVRALVDFLYEKFDREI